MFKRIQILIISVFLLTLVSAQATEGETTTEKDKAKKEIVRDHHSLGERLQDLIMPQKWFSPFLLDHYWPAGPLLTPKYKITDDENKFELRYDVKGYTQDDITIELKSRDQVLYVHGEKKRDDENRHVMTSFQHSFALDPRADTEKITAEMDDTEALVVTVPKLEHTKPLRTMIPIRRSIEYTEVFE
mmetsp:Transcript_11145/g.16260  ORF Transcript_11145/g.16260 Transcript_11145/m.16260 type:complete len:187 (-) Transcript_11145:33-593(-)